MPRGHASCNENCHENKPGYEWNKTQIKNNGKSTETNRFFLSAVPFLIKWKGQKQYKRPTPDCNI